MSERLITRRNLLQATAVGAGALALGQFGAAAPATAASFSTGADVSWVPQMEAAGYYWLTFAADGGNDSFGAQIDAIYVCVTACSGSVSDNFPSDWTSTPLLFEDSFETIGASGSSVDTGQTLDADYGASNDGWPSQGSLGWATGPYDQAGVVRVAALTDGGSQSMELDSAKLDNQLLDIAHEENVWWVKYPFHTWQANTSKNITFYYHGSPRVAVNPPWDGGFIWTHDSTGKPWIAVACQGLGASAWWPCKDYQGDEPDNGATLTINVLNDLIAVGNGRMDSKSENGETTSYTWEVKAPINNYTIIPYIGHYVNWSDTLQGEKGKLDLNYWVLDYDITKAKKQFEQVKLMLRAFEYWFGPYPFYEDGYKLVEAPHLGMEHQSAVAYGNHFLNGYLGNDLPGVAGD